MSKKSEFYTVVINYAERAIAEYGLTGQLYMFPLSSTCMDRPRNFTDKQTHKKYFKVLLFELNPITYREEIRARIEEAIRYFGLQTPGKVMCSIVNP